MTYENIIVNIRKWEADQFQRMNVTYVVTLISSREADESAMTHFTSSFVKEKWEAFEELLKAKNFRSGTTGTMKSRKVIVEMGQTLFQALFTSSIESRDFYVRFMKGCYERQTDVRLLLHIEPDELVQLPWELMCDESSMYLGLLDNPKISIVRAPRRARAKGVRRVDAIQNVSPWRILGMIALPHDQVLLDFAERERVNIDMALQSLKDEGLVEIEWIPTPTKEALEEKLKEKTWHVFHFIGHSVYDTANEQGCIFLEGKMGKSYRLMADQFASLFVDANLMLVILNSCESARPSEDDQMSSLASRLIANNIPVVLAMQYKLPDEMGPVFTKALYEALAQGHLIDNAVAEARRKIHQEEHASPLHWSMPTVHMSVQDGLMFKIVDSTPTPVSVISAQIEAAQSSGSSFDPPQGARPHSKFPRHTKLTKRIQPLPLLQGIGLALLILLVIGASVVFTVFHPSAFFSSPASSSDTCNSPGDGSHSLFIGTDFPTSEKDASAAKLGADLAIKEHHDLGQGYTLNPCDKDDASGIPAVHNPDLGKQNMSLFANDSSVLGVVGPENSNVALKQIPIAVSAGLVMISPSTTNPCLTLPQFCTDQGIDQNQVHPGGKVNTYFRIPGNDLRQGEADATFLFNNLGIHTVCVVDDKEVYGKELAQAFSKNFVNNPGTVILGDRFHISSVDTPAQLADTAALIVALHPQAVFYGGSVANKPGAFKYQLSLKGFTGAFLGGDGIGPSDKFLQDAGSDADKIYATSLGPDPSDLPHPGSFVQDYERLYGIPPTSKSALGYDAAMILITAIQDAVKEHPQNLRNAVRDYVQNIPYSGVTGTITFDSSGDNSGPKIFSVYAVEQGTWKYKKQNTVIIH